MLKQVILLSIVISLAGCAPKLAPSPATLELLPTGESLWKLSLRSGEKPLYAGLLLLNRDRDGAGLVLLDATGIKLLEERVTRDGEVLGITAIRPVADRGLPTFLGRSVHRLFLEASPGPGETCHPLGTGELCQGLVEKRQLVRLRRWGPFVLWEGAYSITNDGAKTGVSGARLHGGWFTPELSLQRRDGAGE